MKGIYWLLFSLASLGLPVNALDKVSVAYGDYKPYFSHSLPNYGVLNKIVREAFLLENITPEFVYSSGLKVRQKIQQGLADTSTAWTDTVERRRYALFSDVLVRSDVVFFHLKSLPFSWTSLTDLHSHKIGTTAAYFYGADFEQHKKQLSIQVAPSDKANFKKLLGRRIDVFPLNLDVGLAILREQFSPEQRQLITYHSTPIFSDPMSLMISKLSPDCDEILMRFNRGLAKLKKSGEFDKYIKELRLH